MLIEFTVGNFRSFKEPVTLSMVAAKLKARDPKVNQNNTVVINDKLTLLTSAAIYGANASGKSNLIKALAFMHTYVLKSSIAMQADEEIGITPFLLNTETAKIPSFFEIVFLLNDITYRYGFEADKNKVFTEWLFYVPRKQEVRLFVRDENGIVISREFKGDKATKKLTRPNALFLSVAAQFNSETAKDVLGWFRSFGIISGLDDRSYAGFTAYKISEDAVYREEILNFIRGSDVDINDVIAEKVKKSERLPKNMPKELKDLVLKELKSDSDDKGVILKTSHTQRNSDGKPAAAIVFNLDEESEGTKKLLLLSGPIIDVLQNGNLIIIDEIEARLHTHLTRKLIRLFNSQVTNPKHAQLIFATHDTNLLSNKLFRRDQIWFVEKDQFSASHLYSLVEIKVGESKVRNDATYEDDYLQGRYGAIPLLGEMRKVILDLNQESDQ